jgi:CheY-like chemotaxis protein
LAAGLPYVRPVTPKKPTRVLVADDEEAITQPVARYLRGLGCVIDAAHEPEEAEALVLHRHYDVAILDLRMSRHGGVQGLDIVREIRRRDPWTAVIVLSAFVSAEVEAEALRSGADAVLRKPQPLADLARTAFSLVGGPVA